MFAELPFCIAEWPDHRGQLVAGTDEAGRGPLAGSVFAAAVILPERYNLPGLNDSKKLSERKRNLLYDQIREQAVAFAIAEVSAEEIDRINIFQASMQAMHTAAQSLRLQPDHVYVDGNHCPRWAYRSTALVKGDSRLDCIAAASILAKVARDRAMDELDQLYPGYGFAKHKGYPTAAHFKALQELGACAIHRRSYAPVAAVLGTTELQIQTA
ncbi:MAG TPA: ribonuclease HII [Pseudohongiella sp.]|nr:ribonuclease HII [Pseudohongiella sp.]